MPPLPWPLVTSPGDLVLPELWDWRTRTFSLSFSSTPPLEGLRKQSVPLLVFIYLLNLLIISLPIALYDVSKVFMTGMFSSLFLVCVCCLFLEVTVFDWRWPGRAREAQLSGPLIQLKTRLTAPFSSETLVEDHEGLLPLLVKVGSTGPSSRRCRMDASLSLSFQSLSLSLSSHSRCSLSFYTESFICSSHCFKTILYLLLFLLCLIFFSCL